MQAEAQILGQLKDAYGVAGTAGTSGPLLKRCLERAFGAAKRVRTETAIARGAANVSTVAVGLATRVFEKLAGNGVHLPPQFFQTEQRAGGYGSFGRPAS